mmetsp:Transcript_12307/g.26976  ORF Transcript_12307/g.26976 Transcript_12307/m.26976 type:complete len:215 (-) Transcript_12307:1603-2247(-)
MVFFFFLRAGPALSSLGAVFGGVVDAVFAALAFFVVAAFAVFAAAAAAGGAASSFSSVCCVALAAAAAAFFALFPADAAPFLLTPLEVGGCGSSSGSAPLFSFLAGEEEDEGTLEVSAGPFAMAACAPAAAGVWPSAAWASTAAAPTEVVAAALEASCAALLSFFRSILLRPLDAFLRAALSMAGTLGWKSTTVSIISGVQCSSPHTWMSSVPR